MPHCDHIDWPCCGCGDDLQNFDDGNLCPGCGEPEACCSCGECDEDFDDRMDGDHESALRDLGWGVDEDYLPGGCEDFDCDG